MHPVLRRARRWSAGHLAVNDEEVSGENCTKGQGRSGELSPGLRRNGRPGPVVRTRRHHSCRHATFSPAGLFNRTSSSQPHYWVTTRGNATGGSYYFGRFLARVAFGPLPTQ